MARLRRSLVLGLLFVVFAAPLPAATIVSWDGANQRGGDLFGAAGGAFDYGSLGAALSGAGHTILAGVSTLSAATLAGVDVFFWGTGTHALSASEGAALAAFVSGGGKLILEADTTAGESAAANAALLALGLGSLYTGTTGGANGATAGLFSVNTTLTTVGAFGDLRGLTFGSSLVTQLLPGSGTIVGSNGGVVSLVEFGVGSGFVLATGDPYGFGLFNNPGESLFNPNNAAAYLNFIGAAAAVPEPSTLILVGVGLLVAGRFTLRRS